MVSRFDITGYEWEREENKDGYFVRYEDYSALEQELASTKAELARARETIIKPWANEYYIANQIVDRDASREWAEARYESEIANKQETHG